MARQFVSFHASAVERAKLGAVLSRYFDYERARTRRQIQIRRLLLVLLGTAVLTLGFHVLPDAALLTVALLTAGCAVLGVRAEVQARRRFAEEMRGVPTASSAKSG
jgi:hypothetical protein